jgi:hypothetical protein
MQATRQLDNYKNVWPEEASCILPSRDEIISTIPVIVQGECDGRFLWHDPQDLGFSAVLIVVEDDVPYGRNLRLPLPGAEERIM